MTKRAARLLFRLMGPQNLLLKKMNDVREIIERSICPDAEMVFGVGRDNSLNDEVRIIILATLGKSQS